MKLGKLRHFQVSAFERLNEMTFDHAHPARLLIGGTGIGKTFIAGEAIEKFFESPAYKNNPVARASRMPVLVLTPNSVVKSFAYKLKAYFGLEEPQVTVMSYRALSAKIMQHMYKELFFGDEQNDPSVEWFDLMNPLFVICDESQKLKNESSQQHQCIAALLKCTHCHFLFMSASPAEKANDLKIFTLACNLYGKRHSEKHWPYIGSQLSKQKDLSQRSIVGMKNLVKHLDPYIVRVPNITTKYRARNSVALCGFANEEVKKGYSEAWQEYCKALAEIGRMPPSSQRFARLVAANKFREASDWYKVDSMMPHFLEDLKNGKSVTIAVNFQRTIGKLVSEFIKQGYTREDISVIWGGSNLFQTRDKSYSKEEIYSIFKSSIVEAQAGGVTEETKSKIDEILLQFKQKSGKIDTLGDLDILGLEEQSSDTRQKELDNFQSGRTKICIFTITAGGAGLDLHHTDDYYFTRPNEYTVIHNKDEEPLSIKDKQGNELIHLLRPRSGYVFPSWSAIDMLQAWGRPHRLTSLSHTEQVGVFFAGTIEQELASILSSKLNGIYALVKAGRSISIDTDILSKQVRFADSFIGTELKKLSSLEQDKVEEIEVEEE